VEDCRRRIEGLTTELAIIGRETAVGVDTLERERSASEKLAAEQERLVGLRTRWESEQGVVQQILGLRAQLRGGAAPVEGTGSSLEQAASAAASSPEASSQAAAGAAAPETTAPAPGLTESERAATLEKLRALQTELAALQGERPLILPSVDAQAVASVVADWTGIPLGRMVKDEVKAVLDLAETLNKRVIGQRHALEAIAARIQTSRAKLDNPNKPIGVFMLAGPSGVGKTETGLALAEALYGGEQNIITINMSEFQEAHTVSTLKGAPPGYVGYGEGGLLTEAVRRKPYSVVLLDEVEKAHPDVHEIFFQVFDKGWMEDAEGRYIDFHNTVILLTTNVGTDLIMSMCKDPELLPDVDGLAQALRAPLLKTFPPALLGRIVTIPYYPLSDEILGAIIRLQLDRIVRRFADNHKASLTYDEAVVDLIAKRCAEVESGARVVDAILTNTVLPAVSRELLNRTLEGRAVARVAIDVGDAGFRYAFD
jgi:type VI secretion system protein VasG